MSAYLDIQKRVTADFINFDYVDLILTTRTKVPDGQGGYIKKEGVKRAKQRFALVEPGNSGFQLPASTEDGQQYTIEFMLLGLFDSLFEKDDVFVYENFKYKIAAVMPFNGYERRAVVIRHGW